MSDIPLDRPGLRCARRSPLECVESWRPLADSAHEPFMDFAAGIAHDIRNLLAVVSTTAQDLLVLADGVPVGTLADVRSSAPVAGADYAVGLRAILDAANRGSDLAAQLQGGAIRNTAVPGCIELNEIVRGVVRLARRVTSDRIAFLQRLDPAGAPAWANVMQFEQVVMNLVLNARDAIEASGGNGAIAVSTSRYGSHTVLRVEDTGVGMTEEVKARIFEPFFTTRAERGGSGLGLAMVRAIVYAAGGSIEVESAPGLGTAFEVHLPRIQPTLGMD